MLGLLLIVGIPIAFAIIFVALFWWKRGMPRGDHWIQLAICFVPIILVSTAVLCFSVLGKTLDHEVWNGQVADKKKVRVSCSHSYQCFCVDSCTTDSKGNRSCTQICQTCYEHSHDFDWDVFTTIGDFSISRIDRQGVNEPPRWSRVQKGDPVAKVKSFTNYVKGADQSLFRTNDELAKRYAGKLPNYPIGLYDYHYIDRVLSVGVPIDAKQWSYQLALKLRNLGIEKQANAIIVFSSDPSPAFADALMAHWNGAKKNDIVIVIGVEKGSTKIVWARVMGWTKVQLFNVKLRDRILDIGEIDQQKILAALHEETMAGFVRRRMREFEYLKHEIDPPDSVSWTVAILAVIASIYSGTFFLTGSPTPWKRGTWHRSSSYHNRRYY